MATQNVLIQKSEVGNLRQVVTLQELQRRQRQQQRHVDADALTRLGRRHKEGEQPDAGQDAAHSRSTVPAHMVCGPNGANGQSKPPRNGGQRSRRHVCTH